MMRHNATTRRGRPGQATRRRVRILLTALGAVSGLVVMSAGAAFAYFTATDSSHPAAALAATLTAPAGGAQNGTATATSIPIKWTAPSGYTPTSYTVLRCTGSSCTPATAVVTGTCSGSITATSCTDTDSSLVAGTTYTYAVEANFDSWLSPASASFQASTTGGLKLTFTNQPAANANINAAGTISPDTFTVAVAVQSAGGVTITGDNTDKVTLAVATGHNPGSGTLACTSGTTVTVVSGVATFTNCSINKAGAGYQLTASSSTSPSLTAPTNANSFNIVAGPATQLAFATSPVSGTTSDKANLGPITLQLQDSDGNPATNNSGFGLIIGLSASQSPSGASFIFATSQYGPSTTTVTIPNGSSQVSFYFGDTKAGSPTITATSLIGSPTQAETVTQGTFSDTDLGNGSPTCSADSCTLSLTTATTSGNTDVIFVYSSGSGHSNQSLSSVTGPFSGGTQYASELNFPPTSDDNDLWVFGATGTGSAGTVTLNFSQSPGSGTLWVDVVQLGAGDTLDGCQSSCTSGHANSGGIKTATVLTAGDSGDSELAFLGTGDSTFFTAPAGFTSIAGNGTLPYGTWANPTVAASSTFTENAANKGWGSIGVEVNN